ncbi:MAG: membrane protein insertase YidC [Thermodesulfobacteriota bacterium]|nr:membrane protein insertase YidC [Thermodesulfobacteriota bacterium]
MEKRTILAFALCFIVLVLWSLFFGPKKDQISETAKAVDKRLPKEILEAQEAPGSVRPELSQVPDKMISKSVPKVDKKEIEIDTPLFTAIFSNEGPTIESFKLKKYYQSIEPDSPLVELVRIEKDAGGFLSIGFDDLSSSRNEKITYQADHETIRLVPESHPKDLVFRSTTSSGLSINQTFRFYPDRYRIDLGIDVINQSGTPIEGTFTVDLKVLPPPKKGYYSYVGLVALLNDELEEMKIKKASQEEVVRGLVDWIAYEDDYFISAIIPGNPSNATFKGNLSPSGLLEGTYLPSSVSLDASRQVSSHYSLYLGPRDLKILKESGKKLERAVNFGWFDIIAKPLLHALRFFYQYVNNYGISIILLTVLVKILFWPLTHKSYKSMKEMQKLQPRMAKIREKYKNNREQLNKEMMALYKTYKVNPMGGCLPMIIQIPVFFALFRILGNSIELRHEPFMLWINDLSAPDRLFSFPFSIPFMAPPYGIPVLTLLMGASMFIQQKMTPTPGDPAQAKIMMFLPIIFTFMFINFPSGLVLYWLVNNILSIGQQYRIHKGPA